MILTAVDHRHNLFSVTDVYSVTLLERLYKTDHWKSAWQREDWQADWNRRRIVNEPGSIYEAVDLYIKSKLPEIEEITNTNILSCDTGFWLDEPGFTTNPHLDNDGVYMAMQVYLTEHPDVDMATEFYNKDNTVRFKPEYKVNHGYLMVNAPGQHHGMLTPVPNNSYRLSSYTWFYRK